MENFIQWISTHALTMVLILVTVYSIWYIVAHRKSLFYKK